MKNISIITFINVIFLIAFIGLISTFLLFLEFDKSRYKEDIKQRYIIIANGFLSNLEFIPTKKELEKLLNEFEVTLIEDDGKRLNILREYREIFRRESLLGRVRVYKIDDSFFIYVQKFSYHLLLRDENPKEYRYLLTISIFFLLFLIILFIYIMLIKKLKPLYDLQRSVDSFAKGDLNVKITKSGNDEIGKIAESFNNAVNYINKLIESKNLFMRNMMHELKTPVTKGRIVVEMIEADENRDILIKVFSRIDEIINELSKIEKINLDILKLNIKKTLLSKLIEKSRELLIVRKNQIIFEDNDIEIEVDRELFTIALKNLIHNAIKFSVDKKAIIKIEGENIEVISKSKPLRRELNYYLEPFYQEEKRDEGLGIGLYVVNSILKAHKLKLSYMHKNLYTHFLISKEIKQISSTK